MRAISVGFATALWLLAGPVAQAQRSPATAAPAKGPDGGANGKFELTVDSIMRGPDLVGWPPTGLRWSADSQNLYFEWRKPGESKASAYVVGREGGTPRKLSDDEAKNVPAATGGRWDKARRRVLFVDDGDVVMVDASAGTRRQITRTTGNESNPRWARNDTHVTWVREGNLFIVPVDSGASSFLTQLTDVAPRKSEPRLTDSQKFIRNEEEKLIDFIEKQKAEKKKTEEEQKKTKLPVFELQERQTAADVMLSPDDTHVFILVSERAEDVKSTIVPNYVNETGYTEDIQARSNVGDAQDRRLLAILNLKTGKSVWADGSFAGVNAPSSTTAESPAERDTESLDSPRGGGADVRRPDRDIRWSMPAVSDDGKYVVAAARSATNKDRWYVALDPETGKTRVIDALHDDAWVREAGFGGTGIEFLPDNKRISYLSERDGWMHLYTLDVSAEGAQAKQLTSGRWEITSAELARDGKKFYITSTEVHPGERHLYTVPVDGGRAHEDHVDDRLSSVRSVARRIDGCARATRTARNRPRCT